MHSSRGPALPLAGSGIKLFLLVASTLRQLVSAHPLASYGNRPDESPGTPQFWWKLGVSVVLILGGGVFAGLTIALMGQDIINLQVLAESGEERERKHAAKVLSLLKRGKHWVLVTLLLCNVLTNESLPIVMDSILPGGLYAVAISTVSIVIFGEIIPQSLCVRYGLPIGAAFVPPTLGLMYLMYPVAYPIAKLLDYLLGDDEGTVYKKAGLKTLVTLHKTLGADRLNEDEVTIITAVLDLKDKSVASVMTPIEDVFTMSADTILDEPMVDTILKEGYSRIPIYQPGNPTNFVGMLLVKILITYDPEDRVPVSNFTLATLPETRPEVSCLDILNFFQEGKSHMVLVSENPGEPTGALGLLTCEDIIEELIGEEIVDESDVYIDVHQKTRRLDTAPLRKGHRINFTSLERRQTNLSNLTAGKPSAVKPLFRPANVAHNPTETKTTKVTIKPTTSANLTPQKTSDRSGVGLRDAQHSDLSASPGPGHTSEQQAMHENLNSDAEEQATDDEAELSDERRPLLLQVPKDRQGHAKAKRTRVRSGSIIETTVEQPDGTIKMVVGCTHDHSALSDAESSESGYHTPKNGTKVPSSQHRRPASARSVGSQASSRDGPLLQIEGDSRDYRTRQAQSQRKK